MRCLPGNLYLLEEYLESPFQTQEEPVVRRSLCIPMEEVEYGQIFYGYVTGAGSPSELSNKQREFIQLVDEGWYKMLIKTFERNEEMGTLMNRPNIRLIGLLDEYQLTHLCDIFLEKAQIEDRIRKRNYLQRLRQKKTISMPVLPEIKEEEDLWS